MQLHNISNLKKTNNKVLQNLLNKFLINDNF